MTRLTKDEARAQIKILVEKFEEYRELYKGKEYDETKTRIEFVNPFFEALGWDIDNHEKRMPHDAEVIHEAKQRQNGKVKAPDYLFQRGKGKPFFYVEAKKPSVDLKNDKSPAFQLRRYGWNGSLKISLLTDFEEFAIYNCTKQPRIADTAKVGRLDYFTYQDYLPKFDFLWDTFARDNAYNGSIDAYTKKFAEVNEKESVSVKFLETLENWRTYLATSIALKNKDLDEAGLNYAVQQTIDRVLFFKIAEDRGLEAPNQLLNATKKGNVYQNIYELFRTADQRYNSGLFDFKKDQFAAELIVDNKVIKNIIDDLYNDESFDFSIIPVEILGYAYEQFLGKVIVFDSPSPSGKGQGVGARIELKPEVRKAGGVFYTPQYIVDYIVENTLGKKIKEIENSLSFGEGKGGAIMDEIAKIKVLDPSCGSGSFLLGAYDYLLQYHLNYYLANFKEKSKERSKYLTDENKLTTSVKKQILLNNIFGVDIDTQAVEVSKLSLLIKCLEGETQSSIEAENKLFKQKVLPTLDGNILCGNSLIAPDFYDNGLFLSPKEERKINVFDWKEGFKAVFKQGGFDLVIGNPPYGAGFSIHEKDYLKQNYPTSDIEVESYLLFIEKSFKFLNMNGISGNIIPSNLLTNIRYEKTRKLLLNGNIEYLIDLGSNVFDQASVDTCIIIFNKKQEKNHKVKTFVGKVSKEEIDYQEVAQNNFQRNSHFLFNIYSSQIENEIAQKIGIKGEKLANLVSFARGVEFGYKSQYTTTNPKVKNAKPLLAGRCINRYSLNFENQYVIFDERDVSNFKDKSIYENEKLLIRRIGSNIIATYDNQNYYNVCDVYNILAKNGTDLKYILAVLNSKLMSFYLKTQFKNAKKLFPKIPIKYLEELPIRGLDLSKKQEKEVYQLIIRAVTTLLELNEKKSKTKLTTEIDQLNNRIKHNENLINEKLYQLYELTQEEIAIIENE
jgi:type I restriction-modification system DNA methylase subunit